MDASKLALTKRPAPVDDGDDRPLWKLPRAVQQGVNGIFQHRLRLDLTEEQHAYLQAKIVDYRRRTQASIGLGTVIRALIEREIEWNAVKTYAQDVDSRGRTP